MPGPSWHRVLPGRGRAPEAARGFLMPLAGGMALVLLLGSLSLQTLVQQQRSLVGEQARQRRAEDALASGAQRLVAQLLGPYRCLATLPLNQWAAAAASCDPPLPPAGLAGLPGEGLTLLEWQPGSRDTRLRLALAPAAGGAAGGDGLSRSYRLRWGADQRAQGLLEVGP